MEKFKIISIHNISYKDFFDLIDSTKEYIQRGFAVTVKRCETKIGAKKLFDEWAYEENLKRYYSFFI